MTLPPDGLHQGCRFRLCAAVAAGLVGRIPDGGGPEVHMLGDLARVWLATRGLRRRLIRAPLPGKIAEAFRHGHNTVPDRAYGTITWAQWVRGKYGVAAHPAES